MREGERERGREGGREGGRREGGREGGRKKEKGRDRGKGKILVECPALWVSRSEPAAIIRMIVWIEDFMNVAAFVRAGKVQCWISSCNVQLF